MPTVSLEVYLTNIDQFGRIWLKIPSGANQTRYKLMALERHYGGHSPISFQSFYATSALKAVTLEDLKRYTGSLVRIHCEFKQYWYAPPPNPYGWKLAIIKFELIGSPVKLL